MEIQYFKFNNSRSEKHPFYVYVYSINGEYQDVRGNI